MGDDVKKLLIAAAILGAVLAGVVAVSTGVVTMSRYYGTRFPSYPVLVLSGLWFWCSVVAGIGIVVARGAVRK